MTSRFSRAYHLGVFARHTPRPIVLSAAVFVLLFVGTTILLGVESEPGLEAQIQTQVAAGHLDEALNLARQALEHYPSSSGLYRLLGTIEFKQNQNDRARADLRRAITLDPSFPQTYYELGQAEFAAGEFQDAASALSTYVRLDPLNVPSRVLLGRAYETLNETRLARNQFQRALQLAPDAPMIHYYLGLVDRREGNTSDALEQFQQEIRINPRFYGSYFLAGDLELSAGDIQRAEQLLLRGTALHPGDDQAHADLGRIFLREHQPARAVTELRLALQNDPRSADLHCALGQAYVQVGAIEDAQLELHACAHTGARRPGLFSARD